MVVLLVLLLLLLLLLLVLSLPLLLQEWQLQRQLLQLLGTTYSTPKYHFGNPLYEIKPW